jgi:Flp pilus assembly protein TadD
MRRRSQGQEAGASGLALPRAVGVALVALVVAAGYLHALPSAFHFDDITSVRDNPALDHPGDLRALWAFRPSRFVLYLSLAWNVALTGRAPAGIRAVNVLVHFLNALLVGWIAAELFRRVGAGRRAQKTPRPQVTPEGVGLIAALLFAAHPLATQAVTYIIQRATSLTALFELAAVALYLKARREGRHVWWALSWSSAVIASFTKETAVILPLGVGLLEFTLRGAGARPVRLALLVPYLVVVPLVNWTSHLYNVEERRALTGLTETAAIGHITYLLTQLVVVPRYLGLWLWPAGQNLDHDVAVHPSLDLAVMAGIGCLVAASVGAALARRRYPVLALGWIWFIVCLIPESSLVPIRDVMYEHRTYLPMAGLAWGAAALLADFAAGGRGRVLAPALVVAALVAVTHARNRVWRDEVSLWSDVTVKSPHKARGFNNVAMALEAGGRAGEAEAAYRRAIAVEPDYIYARVNLGRLYGLAGRYREAVAVLEEARTLAPNEVEVMTNLGTAWWGLGDTTRAAAFYRRALEVAPEARQPALNLARLRGLPASR